MGTKKIDKTNPRNWINGDTFAIKIKNIDQNFDNQYLILTKQDIKDVEGANKNNTKYIFLPKLYKNQSLENLTKEQLEQLECIKTRLTVFEDRYLPYNGLETYEELVKRKSYLKFYPDEYNYLYTYCIELNIKKNNNFSKFIYLGNYNLRRPKDEYLTYIHHIDLVLVEDIEKKLINEYNNYNLKKSRLYNLQECKQFHEKAKEAAALIANYSLKRKELIKQSPKWKDEEEIEESETYVGGGILQSEEKNYEDK